MNGMAVIAGNANPQLAKKICKSPPYFSNKGFGWTF